MWTVSAELGDEDDGAPLLAWSDVDLAAGSVARVALALAALPEVPPPAPLRGRIEFPPAWRRDGWTLELRSAERDRDARRLTIARAAMTPEPGSDGAFRFEVAAVTPGLYVARVPGVELQQTFEQVGGRGADVEVRVPPPCENDVVLVDAGSREVVDVGTISLTPLRDPAICRWSPLRFEFDPQRRAYHLRVAVGEYELRFQDRRFRDPVYLAAGDEATGRIECEVGRACGVSLRIRLGDAPLSSTEIVQRVACRSRGAGGSDRRFYYDPEWLHIAVDGPGLYDVEVEAPPGFRPVAPQTVDVREGEYVALDLRLERE